MLSVKEEIESLELQNKQLQKQIDFNINKIKEIRSKCCHRYEVTYSYGDGDYLYTCPICNDSYVH